LLNGNFTFYLNGQEIFADVKTNDKISFITLEFPGKGLHKLDIIGTTTITTTTTTPLPESSEITPLALVISLALGISLIGIVFLKKFKKKIIH